MNGFLMYLSGVVISFIMSVITFRFTRFELNKKDINFMMPVLVFVWFMSWIGAITMLLIFIVDIIIHNTILNKLYTKITNGFIKLIGQ